MRRFSSWQIVAAMSVILAVFVWGMQKIRPLGVDNRYEWVSPLENSQVSGAVPLRLLVFPGIFGSLPDRVGFVYGGDFGSGRSIYIFTACEAPRPEMGNVYECVWDSTGDHIPPGTKIQLFYSAFKSEKSVVISDPMSRMRSVRYAS